MHKPLEYWHVDSAGKKAPVGLVDNRYFHPKTGHIYEVEAIDFDAQRERWVVRYRQVNASGVENKKMSDCSFVHLPEDFLMPGRFLEVK